jgi:tyrosyl-tRNA synthetase
MSKSKPWTAIFIHDTPQQIKEKLTKAWCPEKQVEMNPVLEIAKYVVFHENKTFKIERPPKFGGPITFQNYQELEKAYANGDLHPQDLKNAIAEELAKILKPLREYFENDKEAKESLETVKKAQITR